MASISVKYPLTLVGGGRFVAGLLAAFAASNTAGPEHKRYQPLLEAQLSRVLMDTLLVVNAHDLEDGALPALIVRHADFLYAFLTRQSQRVGGHASAGQLSNDNCRARVLMVKLTLVIRQYAACADSTFPHQVLEQFTTRSRQFFR